MTIKDIAKEAGYSVGTVSRVLNNHPDVSDKARKKVMAVVKKNHFKLNNNAKHLKQQSNSGIAVIVKGNNNMLFATIVEKLQGLIKERGYVCLIYYIDEDENEVEQALQICRERQPMGILFLGSDLEYYLRSFWGCRHSRGCWLRTRQRGWNLRIFQASVRMMKVRHRRR